MSDSKLPENAFVIQFAAARMKEITALSSALDTKHGPKRVYQTLPRNLRRRAMSYDVKRMPRTLREQHKKELEKQGRKPPTKRPSRKYRRRPKRLLEDYTRRKQEGKNTWLETHVWHAKRFKMSDLWGYKIPTESCCKNKRLIYRALVKSTVVEDISYYSCIELKGKQKILMDGLSTLTSSECGETFKSQNAIGGEREGRTLLYKSNQYPYNAIGPVKFLWKPIAESEISDESERMIWIWVHPAIHEEILKEFIHVFGLEKGKKRKLGVDGDEVIENVKKKFKSESTEVKVDTRVSHIIKPKNGGFVYIGSEVVLTDLRDSLIRFRVTGPQSTRVLGCVLRPVVLKGGSGDSENGKWKEICDNGSLTELTPRCVLGFDVRDPRLFMPAKKQVPKINDNLGPSVVEITNGLCQSRLWDEKIRNEVTFGKSSDECINKIRSNCTVPGMDIDLGENEPQIPIILIQNPGNRNSVSAPMNFGAGWDLILPSSWGMPFWISLIYNTALPAALDTSKVVNSAQCVPFFPYDFPDTKAGVEMTEKEKDEMMERDLKRPPAKRVNYQALKIASPFMFPWNELIKNYHGSSENVNDNFFVLRDRRKLKKLNILLQKQQNSPKIDLEIPKSCLIFVQLKPVAKGIVDRLSLICLPTEDDLIAFKQKSYSNITETPNPKSKSEESTKKKFAKCRKERKAIRRKLKNVTDEEEKKELEERIEEIQPKLQLPDYSQNDIKNSCSRKVIGFVTSCQFELSVGEVVAMGYCVDEGMKMLLNSGHNIVLLRKKTSLSYTFAKTNIVFDF